MYVSLISTANFFYIEAFFINYVIVFAFIPFHMENLTLPFQTADMCPSKKRKRIFLFYSHVRALFN